MKNKISKNWYLLGSIAGFATALLTFFRFIFLWEYSIPYFWVMFGCSNFVGIAALLYYLKFNKENLR